MVKPTSLNMARADKSGNCHDWTALDLARDLVSSIENGDLKPDIIYVAMIENDPADPKRYARRYSAAGGARLELKGMLLEHITLPDCLG